MTKLLGIDWGSKRVGLALGTTDTRVSLPLKTRDNTPELMAQLKQLCRREGVEAVVLGLPRGLEGQETAQTKQVRQFARVLEEALGLEVKLQDESLTSEVSKAAQDVDAAAAAIILHDYLETA